MSARLVTELQAVTLGINLVGLDRLPEVMRDGAAPAQSQDIATMTDTNTDHGGAVVQSILFRLMADYPHLGDMPGDAAIWIGGASTHSGDRDPSKVYLDEVRAALHPTPQTDTDAREKVVEASQQAGAEVAKKAFDEIHALAAQFNPLIHDQDDTLGQINQIALHAYEALRKTAPSRTLATTVAESVVLSVCELPDRSSPKDWPEAMLVAGEELHHLVYDAVLAALKTGEA